MIDIPCSALPDILVVHPLHTCSLAFWNKLVRSLSSLLMKVHVPMLLFSKSHPDASDVFINGGDRIPAGRPGDLHGFRCSRKNASWSARAITYSTDWRFSLTWPPRSAQFCSWLQLPCAAWTILVSNKCTLRTAQERHIHTVAGYSAFTASTPCRKHFSSLREVVIQTFLTAVLPVAVQEYRRKSI